MEEVEAPFQPRSVSEVRSNTLLILHNSALTPVLGELAVWLFLSHILTGVWKVEWSGLERLFDWDKKINKSKNQKPKPCSNLLLCQSPSAGL